MRTSKTATTPLREQMFADMSARNLNPHAQRSHIHSCKRFAAFLGRSPETASADEVKAFQLHLIESGASICNRNRIMSGVKFLLKVTLRRHDLAEPDKFARYLRPRRKAEWIVYAKRPFGGLDAVRSYLSRYTHRIAISNRRLVSADQHHVALRYKDYRASHTERW